MTDNEQLFDLCDIGIYTLGKFCIKRGNTVLSESSRRSKRMWEIFKFLLSHREKSFFPEVMLEKIWPESDYSDPNLVIRSQVFRLRQALRVAEDEPSLADNIIFHQGGYSWTDKTPYNLDVNDLEASVSEAGLAVDEDPGQAIKLYRKAIAIYKGIYLPELSHSEWIEPLRSYYHNIYLDCLFDLVDLLKARREHSEIVKLCEQAASIDCFEEKIHIKLIEALLAQDQVNRARAYYNEVTTFFYREMGIKPSEQMKNLYRLVVADPGSFELDLTTIQEGLKSKDADNGAYYCDVEFFRYFYKLERARFERNGQSVLLGLFTLTTPNYSLPDKKNLKVVMENLQDVILQTLRKGDLVTRWNDAQMLVLLPGLKREQAEMVIGRIEKKFNKLYSLQGLVLHKKVESLLPLESEARFF